MFKWSFLFILIFLLIGCSNEKAYQEKVTNLENDLAKINDQLEEKESELQVFNQLLEEKESELQSLNLKLEEKENEQMPLYQRLHELESELQSFYKDGRIGSTKWREWDLEFDQSLSAPNQAWETPGLLLLAWMNDVEKRYWLNREQWNINTRIDFYYENDAIAYIKTYGYKDDSIAGEDIKLTMKKYNGFWFIESIETRAHCARGRNADDLERCL